MNKFYFFIALMIISAMLSCSADKDSAKATAQSSNTPTETSTPASNDATRNAQDSKTQTVTPTDQLENSADLKVTQQIRKSIMDDSSLSTNAKNIKIVTQEHAVTLSGLVDSTKEKRKVGNIARQVVTTTKNVHNKLEVKSRS